MATLQASLHCHSLRHLLCQTYWSFPCLAHSSHESQALSTQTDGFWKKNDSQSPNVRVTVTFPAISLTFLGIRDFFGTNNCWKPQGNILEFPHCTAFLPFFPQQRLCGGHRPRKRLDISQICFLWSVPGRLIHGLIGNYRPIFLHFLLVVVFNRLLNNKFWEACWEEMFQ